MSNAEDEPTASQDMQGFLASGDLAAAPGPAPTLLVGTEVNKTHSSGLTPAGGSN